ncbi:la-related protein 6b [Plectropomus leopardus]|uniref:la-related protein 6b n=1 Tax=Plectropomus leopardus TaxID=160734 RepID=UPI001C4D2D21|nr:la-related protein 6b [Plectropomus leopardus]
MSNPTGDDAQSAGDEKEREGELLCLKIKAQLEDLLSDSHLAEDGFLLKHVQRNKQGYVSLKLLTCLKKIKVLTSNWCMTLAGAERSELLEVNDERTKVRRREPLPKWLLCSPTSKLLLAWNLCAGENLDRSSLSERILQKFSAHGSVTSLSILHPGKELPKELQCYAKRHKELGQHLCAVVKFDCLEEVRKAYDALKAEEESGEGMCVATLGFQSMHHNKEEPSDENPPRDAPSQENPLVTSKDLIQEESSLSYKVSDETSGTFQTQKSLDNSVRRTFEQISTSCNNQPFSALNQRYSKRSWCSGDCDNVNSPSPWVLRRKFAASALNPKVAGYRNAPCLMQRVLRQPLGPDSTRGFQRRGRLL